MPGGVPAPASSPAAPGPPRRLFLHVVLPLLLLALLVGSLGATARWTARRTGLFFLVGADFSHYWAMWRAAQRDGPQFMYDTRVLHHHRRILVNSHRVQRHPHRRVSECGTPYPPLYGVLLSPFTRLAPRHAFAAWLAIQFGLAAWVAWRAAALLRRDLRVIGFVLAFASYPVLISHFIGQFQMATVVFLAECFLALRGGREFRGGLWLGALAIKPHYAVLLLGYLLWQRRLRALLGTALAGVAILLASWAVAGSEAMLAYPRLALGIETCAPEDYQFIIGWRALVVWLAPALSITSHFRVSTALGLATLASAAWLTRGAWSPAGPRFPVTFSLLVVATLLANYHIDPYGAAILTVPLVAAIGGRTGTRTLALVATATAVLPSVVFFQRMFVFGYGNAKAVPPASQLTTIGLVLLFATLAAVAVRERRASPPGALLSAADD